jgi:8-oxo-dGTP diphosphatase
MAIFGKLTTGVYQSPVSFCYSMGMKPTIIPAGEAVDLRRGIDHIGIGVAVIVHDGQGNILLMKRGPKARDEQGRWDICGGAIEFGESFEDAVHRELMEELCVRALELDRLAVYDAHREHEGQPTHWVQVIHAARVDPTVVKIGEPHKISEINWFNSGTLPEPRHSQFDKAYTIAREKGLIR